MQNYSQTSPRLKDEKLWQPWVLSRGEILFLRPQYPGAEMQGKEATRQNVIFTAMMTNGFHKQSLSLSLSLSVTTLSFVWKFSCINFCSLIHALMYINDACTFIFTHQQLSKDKLLDRLLTEPKLQSLLNKVFEFEFSLSFSIRSFKTSLHRPSQPQ